MSFLSKVKKKINVLKNEGNNIDKPFVYVFFLILIIGIIALFSASLIYAEKKTGNQYFYIKGQILKGVIPSIILFLFFAYVVDYRKKVRKFSNIAFIGTIFLLILVLIPGIGMYYGGARSWLNLGFITFQPAEILKLTLIMFLSLFFEKNKDIVKEKWGGVWYYIILMFVIAILLLLQPDLGTLLIICVISFAIYFFAGMKGKIAIGLLGVASLALLIFLKIDNGVRTMRIDLWLHPDNYSKTDEGYQINQAMIAVGTGGIFGRGIMNSVEKFSYLPEVIADSIFAVIAEELGFVFTVMFILVPYFVLLWRMVKIIKGTNDSYGRYFIVGVVAWIGFQVFVNIGAMIRLCPLTGVPLPFISYGSTSMWVLSVACGIVANISKNSVNFEKKNINKYDIIK